MRSRSKVGHVGEQAVVVLVRVTRWRTIERESWRAREVGEWAERDPAKQSASTKPWTGTERATAGIRKGNKVSKG